ncbi:hypothetical protein PIB30_110747, partial [Stylosanthes scabra]|nr:hypothetical protein [Stylosanthes scabra]
MPRGCGCFRRALWPMMLLPYVILITGLLLLYIGSGYKHSNNLSEFIMGLGIFMLLAFLFSFTKFESLSRAYLRDNSDGNNSIDITRNLRVVPWLDSDENLMITIEVVNRTTQEQSTEWPFSRSARVARLALRALPPSKSFKGKKEEEEGNNEWGCSICLEEFKNGELIQPLGVCVHEFHSD